jgi:hypothetical protein
MEKPEIATRSFGPIHDRIGPIFDTAFLKILNEEQIKTITLTVAKAELAAAVAQAKALEEIVKTVEAVKVQAGGR